MNDALPTLAETLREAGWSTAAFVSASVLDSRYGAFTWVFDLQRPHTARKKAVLLPADPVQTVDDALDWLSDKDDEQPVFLWVHLFDPSPAVGTGRNRQTNALSGCNRSCG